MHNDKKQSNNQNCPCPAPEPKRDIDYGQRQKQYCFRTTNQISAGSDMPPSLQFAAVRVFIARTIPQSRADSHLVWALMKSALFTSSYPMVSIRIKNMPSHHTNERMHESVHGGSSVPFKWHCHPF